MQQQLARFLNLDFYFPQVLFLGAAAADCWYFLMMAHFHDEPTLNKKPISKTIYLFRSLV
jgi:hypothetical protein